jgi:hypothetical protein
VFLLRVEAILYNGDILTFRKSLLEKGNKILIDFSIPKGLRKLREKSDFAPLF